MGPQNELSGLLWKPGPRLKAAGRAVLDLAFPPATLDPGPRPLSFGLSAETWTKIHFLEDPVCDACGSPFAHDMGAGARCAACRSARSALDRVRAACLYDEYSRGPILALKHADRTDLAPLFARWLSRAGRILLAEADALVPVPLHPRRLIARRFNQAAEIARPLARLWSVDYLPDALVRRRDTGTQGGKSGAGRRRNVAAAFTVSRRGRRRVEGRRLVLIDDVMTTGATLEGCARALRAAGAVQVDALVVARVKEAHIEPI